MRRKLILLLSVLTVACSKQVDIRPSAQENHSIAQSLPNSTVNCFVQDHAGYVWMGTNRGLARYDGETFQIFLRPSDGSDGLPSNSIVSMTCDSEGRVWAGTISGVAMMNDRNEFVPVVFDHSGSRSESILQFAEDSKGTLYLSTGDMLQEYDPQEEMFVTRLLFDNGKAMYRFAFDEKDRLWYLSEGIVRFKESVSSPGRGETLEIAGSGISQMVMLPNSVLCTMNGEGFTIWSSALNVLLYKGPIESISCENVTSVIPAESTSFYIITRQGEVFLYDFANQQLDKVDAPSDTKTIFMDKEENVWLGTARNGFEMVSKADLMGTNEYGFTSLYRGVFVEKVFKASGGRTIVSTASSVAFLSDSKMSSILRIDFSPFTDLSTRALFVDSSDRLWLSTVNKCYVFQMGAVTPLENRGRLKGTVKLKELMSFNAEEGTMFLEDSFGNVWLSTNSHYLYVLPKGETEPRRIKIDVESGYMFVPEIIQASNGMIRIAAFHYGVFEADPITFELRHTMNLLGRVKMNYLPTCLLEASDGTMWLGTNAEGVYTYDPKDGELTHVDNIDCESIYSLVESPKGVVWAVTADGLYRYGTDNDSVIHIFDEKNVFAPHATVLLNSGKILFGGSAGVFMLDPSGMELDTSADLHFDDVFVNGVMVSPGKDAVIDKSLMFSPEVNLRKGMGSVSFSFSSPSFGKAQFLEYWYKLSGYDKDWQKVRFGRTIQYSRLPEGHFTLMLEARNRLSGKVVDTETLDVVVHSPFLTSRFMMVFAYPLMLLFIIAFAVFYYIKSKKSAIERQRILKEKEAEADMNKMNVSFFTNMSHEFRTPLTLISGPMDEISEALEDTPYNRGLLKTVKNSVNRMLKLVDQIMDFSKLETDALNLSLCECDIASVYRNIVLPFQYACSKKGIKLEVADTCDGCRAFVDSDKFEKILNNLMSNAVKYTPGGPGAMIKASLDVMSASQAAALFRTEVTSHSDSYLVLSVSDTGQGIPENMREEVFERYRRLDLPGHDKEFGSGIGLYYARRLATLHHGLIEADQSPFGQGSCFRLLLPMDKEEYAGEIFVNGTPADIYEASSPEEFSEEPASDHRPEILLVEDDVDVASYISSLLGKYYDVQVKYSADDACEALKFKSPDLVITDVMVPGNMDGLGLCTHIKENLDTCHIPVMVLSAKSTLEDQIRGIETGADSYVTKPVAPAYLLTLTKSLLANREKLRARIQQTTDLSAIPDDNLSPQDRHFLENLYEVMESQLSSAELNVDAVAESLKISRAKLYYKFKGLINETPNSFFKKYKLNRAAELLKSGKYNVSEVSDMTGFSSLSYFSVSFKKQFGVKPSDYS